MRGSQLTVLCVDDHHLVRECVASVIAQDPAVRIAAEAGSVKDALRRFSDTRPDVTLVSLHPRGLDGLAAIRAIRRQDPRARIVVYAMNDTDAVYVAMNAGAAAFVLETAASIELVRAIKAVHARHDVPPLGVRGPQAGRAGLPSLTTREVQIVELLSRGFRTKAIAATLRISHHTVKAHIKNMYGKLGVQGRAAALAEALRRGLVQLAATQHVSRARHRRQRLRAPRWAAARCRESSPG